MNQPTADEDRRRASDELADKLAAMEASRERGEPLDAELRQAESELETIANALQHEAPTWAEAVEPGRDAAVEVVERLFDQVSARGAAVESFPRQLGQYLLLAKLGEGGMGAVYLAEHERLRRPVALKMLSPHRTPSASALTRFQREMLAAGKLSHPNIVVAHDAGEEDGTHYLAMELVEGVHLGQMLEQLGPLPVADACEAVSQAARGLHHAHQRGMIHRDIKPSNLMVAFDAQGRAVVKVLDLGLARFDAAHGEAADELTAEGQMMGTIDYMAPEQTDGREVGPRSDVYSLGATLYKLLTGVAPYAESGRTLLEKLSAMARGPAPSIRRLRSDLPAELADLIDGFVSPDPVDRPSSAEQLADALAPYAESSELAQRLAETPHQQLAAAAAATLSMPASARPSMPPTSSPSAAVARPPRPAVEAGAGVRAWAVWATVAALLLVAGILGFRTWYQGLRQETGRDDPITVAQANDRPNGNTELQSRESLDQIEQRLGQSQLPAPQRDGAAAAERELALASKAADQQADKARPLAADRDRRFPLSPPARPFFGGAGARSMPFPGARGLGARSLNFPPSDLIKLREFRESHPQCRVASSQPDVDVAFWIVGQQGSVRLTIDGRSEHADTIAQIPREPFAMTSVDTRGKIALTDEDVDDLARLPQLHTARVPNSRLTDAAIPALAALTTLRELDLSGSTVTNAGVKSLAGSSRLTLLMLNNTQVDDEAVEDLGKLQSLLQLGLQGSKVSPAARARLQSLLPKTRID